MERLRNFNIFLQLWLIKLLTQPQLHNKNFKNYLTHKKAASFGFVFWMLAAKLYPKDVGVATVNGPR